MPVDWSDVGHKIFGKDGLYISIIAAILVFTRDFLKEKFKETANWLLDSIGKVTKGKLASRRFLKLYHRYLLSFHQYLQLVGFNTAGIRKPLLEEVYISLKVSNFEKRQNPVFEIERIRKDLHLQDALKRFPRLAILGIPGAGKSTILSYIIISFLNRKAEERFGLQDELLPIFIPLRRLSSQQSTLLDDILKEECKILPREIITECPLDFFLKRIQKGQCIFFLDGLDEVTDEEVHNTVAAKINNFISLYPTNRYIVTCRIAGWKNLLNDFTILELNDLSKEQIGEFIYGWNRAIIVRAEMERIKTEVSEDEFGQEWTKHLLEYVNPAIAKITLDLTDAIHTNDRLLFIAKNPMLLSLINLVHFNRASLPKGRAELYNQCIELLIDHWDRLRNILSPSEIGASEKEIVLRNIAFNFQVAGKGEETRENLETIVKDSLNDKTLDIKKLIDSIEKRSGILVEKSINVFAFSHLTLQEYLSAKHVHLNWHENYNLLISKLDHQEWREVILLYSGLIGDVTKLVEDILLRDEETEDARDLNLGTQPISRLLLVAHCINNARTCSEKLVDLIIEELLSRLDSMTEEKTEEVVESLTLIAEDYEGMAKTIRERLPESLIKKLSANLDVKM